MALFCRRSVTSTFFPQNDSMIITKIGRENSKMIFLESIKSHFLLMDGAMGTYYAQKYPTEEDISELANITHPERIEHIHTEYITAGAQLLRTNSFASHAEGLTGLPLHRADDRQAALHTDGKVWIAGDIGSCSSKTRCRGFRFPMKSSCDIMRT